MKKEELKVLLDGVLRAMESRDPLSLPMAERYKATENGIPAAVRHMTCFRTIVSIKCVTHRVIDPVRDTALAVAEADEGSDATSLVIARIKVTDGRIEELELFLLRSRCQAGFWFEPEGLSQLPEGWTDPIPEGERASREELFHLGQTMINDNIKTEYLCAENTYLMENGSPVREHIDYLMGTLFEGPRPPTPASSRPAGEWPR